MREVEWTEAALGEMAALDRTVARRIRAAIERFASTGAGDVRKLKGVDSPEHRLRVGDWRVRFELTPDAIRILHIRHRREAYR